MVLVGKVVEEEGGQLVGSLVSSCLVMYDGLKKEVPCMYDSLLTVHDCNKCC